MTDSNLRLGCHFLQAVHHSGTRVMSPIHLVIHATDGGCYRGAAKATAEFFTRVINEDSPGSAHIVVDEDECYRCLHDNVIPWAVPPFNASGLHMEFCGKANWSRTQWLRHKPMLDRGAKGFAGWSLYYNIPPVWLTVDRCKRRLPGITSHANVSRAFGLSDHTDPGDGFPFDYLLGRIAEWRYRLETTREEL